MKHLAFFAITFLAAVAFAQAPATPEKPKEAAKPAAEPAKQAANAPRKQHRRWNEDARHCLDLPTNTEIIKCAEEYL